MPMIRVEMFAGRTVEQKNLLAQKLTESFVEICGGTPQSVQIIFTDVAKTDWAVAGQLVSERERAGTK